MFCWPSDFEVIPKKSNIFEVCGGNSRNGPMTVASVIALHNFEGCNPYQSHPKMRFQHVPLWVVLTKCSTLKNMTVLVTLVSDGAKITWLRVSNVYKHAVMVCWSHHYFFLSVEEASRMTSASLTTPCQNCRGKILSDGLDCEGFLATGPLAFLTVSNGLQHSPLRRNRRFYTKYRPNHCIAKVSWLPFHSRPGVLVWLETWTWKTRKSIKIPNMSWFSWNWQTPTNSATSMSWFRLICLIE